MRVLFISLVWMLAHSCQPSTPNMISEHRMTGIERTGVEIIVLGTVQDAGSPHAACTKACCKGLFNNPDHTRKVVSLGIIDHDNDETYLIEATPDLTEQMMILQQEAGSDETTPNGVFITHGHIGHYTGLMYLGKEAMNASSVPTYVMPRMQHYLSSDGPWSQLVKNQNIDLLPMRDDSTIVLNDQVSITPMLVPHRDEFSETVGFVVSGPSKSLLFIPDIDKWDLWEHSLIEILGQVDLAYIDATFYDGAELGNRDMSTIPHPFVVESMQLLDTIKPEQKDKIYFTHFNHTNALLDTTSNPYHHVLSKGYHVASYLHRHVL